MCFGALIISTCDENKYDIFWWCMSSFRSWLPLVIRPFLRCESDLCEGQYSESQQCIDSEFLSQSGIRSCKLHPIMATSSYVQMTFGKYLVDTLFTSYNLIIMITWYWWCPAFGRLIFTLNMHTFQAVPGGRKRSLQLRGSRRDRHTQRALLQRLLGWQVIQLAKGSYCHPCV